MQRAADGEAQTERCGTQDKLGKVTAELESRNTALRSLGQQLLRLREQLGAEREWSAQLQGKVRRLRPRA